MSSCDEVDLYSDLFTLTPSEPTEKTPQSPGESSRKRKHSQISNQHENQSNVANQNPESEAQTSHSVNRDKVDADDTTSLAEKYEKLSGKCKQLQRFGWSQVQQVKELTRRNKVLQNNISSLFKTARAEVDRKDAQIASLREQLDRLLFRRSLQKDAPQKSITHS